MITLLLPFFFVTAQEGESVASHADALQSTDIEWAPYTGELEGGAKLEGEIASLSVPENRGRPEGKQIEIEFVRFKSTNPEPGPPIYYLIGGPGVTATRYAAQEATMPEIGLLEFGDFIGINQRGTGNSELNAEGAPTFEFRLPLDEVATRATRLAAQKKAMADCSSYWTEQGVDLSAYNSIESADDIDAVRRALGHEKIVLWGTSYGSHLALAYLRRHREHVARAVLMKVEGPDHTYKLPSTADAQLDRLQECINGNPQLAAKIPDLKKSIQRLTEQLAKTPVEVVLEPPGRDPVTVVMGPHDLHTMVAMHLGFTGMLARLPRVIHELEAGHWKMLAMASINLRGGGVESAMAMMMDASSGGSEERLGRIERETSSGKFVLGDALNFNLYPESTTACGSPDVGAEFRGPLKCSVPVLFISGDLDARTPASNVDEIIGGFRSAAHILVKGTGHDARELTSPEYCALVRSFLGGAEVKSQTVTLEPLEFMPIR